MALTVLVLTSYFWNGRNLDDQAEYLATEEARANWNKDQAFRGWATLHGGVYVPVDERTPPNEYLAHLPNRDVETTDGLKLTLMNPAYMMTQMTREFEAQYGIKGKITGQVLLNPKNEADPWELAALKLFDQGVTEVLELSDIDGEHYIRLIRPMVMVEGCVLCHGHLGFEVGDIRGGVSVSVPMAAYIVAADSAKIALGFSHSGVWAIGLLAIGFVSRRGQKRDVERRVSEEKIKASEAKLTEILDIAPEAVITVAEDSAIQFFNNGAEQIFGHQSDDVVGQPLEILLPDRFRHEHRRHFDRFDRSGETYLRMGQRQDIFGLTKDGTEFPAAASVSKLKIGDEKIFTVMLRDVTERRQMDEDRRQALIQAEEANQAKTDFLATMSHELRTPLNAIIGFSDMIEAQIFGALGSEKYSEYAHDIRASSEHLLALVNDILDLSAVEAGKQPLAKEEIVVAAVVADCARIINIAAKEKEIKFAVGAMDSLPPLHADRRAVKQILFNLLSNAVKYTNRGGEVFLGAHASNRSHTFTITDNGNGIPEEKLETVTDPFVRSESDPHMAQQGSGLGLAIVKSLVDLHDTKLTLESEVGVGTTVTVTLPRKPA
ncbi:MAG: DUF3365 domain-containing protein [Alphaproteobacteria bacterium]|jgi:two-component system, chemotaxis family, sensor kinase Cph1|nr:DUF3365 domain-containing protein [Alphaproteobacteria bacterium]